MKHLINDLETLTYYYNGIAHKHYAFYPDDAEKLDNLREKYLFKGNRIPDYYYVNCFQVEDEINWNISSTMESIKANEFSACMVIRKE